MQAWIFYQERSTGMGANAVSYTHLCYAKVGDARALASVIGEDELSPLDKKYLQFGKAFEAEFVGQTDTENRSIIAVSYTHLGNHSSMYDF